MRTTLPTLKHDEVNGKRITTRGEIAVTVIDSIQSQINWENQFPIQSKEIALTDYIDRIRNTPKERWNSAVCLSALKALFCYLEFDTPLDFKGFCGLFKMNDLDFLNEFVDRINQVFNLVYPQDKKKD